LLKLFSFLRSPHLRRYARTLWYRPSLLFRSAKNFHAKLSSGTLQETFDRKPPTLKEAILSGQISIASIEPIQKTPEASVTIVIPNKNACRLIDACLRAILKTTDHPDFEVVIVDNQSFNPFVFLIYSFFSRQMRLRTIRGCREFNFSKLVNLGAAGSSSDFIVLMNNDVRPINKNWLIELLRIHSATTAAVVGPILLYPDNTIQHASVVRSAHGYEHIERFAPISAFDKSFDENASALNVFAVTGALQVVRRSDWISLGGYDENFPENDGDIDFCVRASGLGPVVLATSVRLIHIESASRGYGGAA
jgi:O-antigen biosynthesis protein